MPHWLDKVIMLLKADTANLRELARIAGADPKIFYRGIDPNELDLAGQDIEGMEFSSPTPVDQINDRQLQLDLPALDHELRPEQVVYVIKSAPRQEERTALLLAEFLQDRARGMQIVSSYMHDKAQITNDVLHLLTEIRSLELAGRRFTNLQIARKVSGRFARAEDKRSVLAYFFAKHLRKYSEIREWLKHKSISKLPRERQEEFTQYLREH